MTSNTCINDLKHAFYLNFHNFDEMQQSEFYNYKNFQCRQIIDKHNIVVRIHKTVNIVFKLREMCCKSIVVYIVLA